MRALDCVDVRDVAPEFCFGVLDGAARADVVHHLEHCPRCRTLVAELSEAADSVVLLAPEAEPPPGFEQRVMARLSGGERRRLRTAKLVAVVAAAAVILSIVTVRVIDRSRASSDSAGAVTATVPMIGGGGQRVGEVQVIEDRAVASLALTVDYALDDGDYRVVLDPEGEGRRALGTMTVAGGRGSWVGTARVGDPPTDLALVDDAGQARCSARLPSG